MNPPQDNTKVFLLEDDGTFPNNPHWPLLIYVSAIKLPPTDPAAEVEKLFRRNNWRGLWRDGIYPYHHYHSNQHEVLGCYAGHAQVQFGGPEGVQVELRAGDVAVLPAGTAHKKLGASTDFGVVGAYPSDENYDMCYGTPEERREALTRIAKVPRPATDPVFGNDGGLLVHWPPKP